MRAEQGTGADGATWHTAQEEATAAPNRKDAARRKPIQRNS